VDDSLVVSVETNLISQVLVAQPVIPATQEAEIMRIVVQSQLPANGS
jgi:hypothetical protein